MHAFFLSLSVSSLSLSLSLSLVSEVLDDIVSGGMEDVGGVGGGVDLSSSSSGELCPLFHQPGKPGFYSVRVGTNTPSRLNAYRNIGRLVVLLLLCSYLYLSLCLSLSLSISLSVSVSVYLSLSLFLSPPPLPSLFRVIGLALLHSEMMPLPFCRHIYKYLLNKKV